MHRAIGKPESFTIVSFCEVSPCCPDFEPSLLSFEDMMEAVKADGKPVALCYGKEDPWIQPIWGHRAKRVLTEVLAPPL